MNKKIDIEKIKAVAIDIGGFYLFYIFWGALTPISARVFAKISWAN
jgi:hypothetical protein